MNSQRKKIIISEIYYWKKNRLLPEQYCDFLITLYAQGESGENESTVADKAVLEKEKNALSNKIKLMIVGSVILLVLLFLAKNYFMLALGVAMIFTIILLLPTLFSKSVKKALLPATYIISAFMILGISLKVWFVFFEGETMLLLGLLMLNSILWLFAGRLLNLLYFTISGSAGLLMVIGFLLISY